jgi:hypothetical protein
MSVQCRARRSRQVPLGRSAVVTGLAGMSKSRLSEIERGTAPSASLRCLDWAGFHTAPFAQRFRPTTGETPRPPRIGVHPLGIDRKAIEALAQTHAPHRRPATSPLVVSIDHLDYAKAPLEKIKTIAPLLTHHPELHEHLRFRLVCAPPEPGFSVAPSRTASTSSTPCRPTRTPPPVSMSITNHRRHPRHIKTQHCDRRFSLIA